MAGAKDIHQLIHSLTKNEQGFFMKYAQMQGKDKDYLDLYKKFQEMPNFSKRQLEQAVQKESYKKHLSVTQNYLYKTLLKSLRLFHEKQSVDVSLQNLITEADILESKGLKKLSQQQLEKAKKLAVGHHKFTTKIEILKRQASHILASKVHNLFEELDGVYKEVMDDIHTIKEEYTYRQLNHFMFIAHRKEARSAFTKYAKLLKTINEHPILKQKETPRSFYAKYLRNNVFYIKARIAGDQQQAYKYSKNIVDLWYQHKLIQKANPKLFKIQLSNFIGNIILNKKTTEFDTYVEKLESITSKNKVEEMENFQAIAHLKLLFFLNLNRLEDAKLLVPYIKNGMAKYGSIMNQARKTILFHNTLVLHFVLEEFEDTLEWIDLILRKQKTEPRQDIKTFARILEFVIHYELGNDLILESLFISATRRLHKTGKSGQYEKTILRHFRQLLKAVDKTEKRACFQDFKEKLQPFAEAKPKPVGVEELLYWLEARLTNRTIREVFAGELAHSS